MKSCVLRFSQYFQLLKVEINMHFNVLNVLKIEFAQIKKNNPLDFLKSTPLTFEGRGREKIWYKSN